MLQVQADKRHRMLALWHWTSALEKHGASMWRWQLTDSIQSRLAAGRDLARFQPFTRSLFLIVHLFVQSSLLMPDVSPRQRRLRPQAQRAQPAVARVAPAADALILRRLGGRAERCRDGRVFGCDFWLWSVIGQCYE